MEDEADVIRRAQAGDQEAFRWLMERYHSTLTKTAYLTVRDNDLVEDVIQETLVETWKSIPSYRPTGSFKGWLLKVLVNRARRQYRKKRVETSPMEMVSETQSDSEEPDKTVLRDEQDRELEEALERIASHHRDVLVLRYFSDLTVPEIAKALDCREGTVKSRLSRALHQLAQHISGA